MKLHITYEKETSLRKLSSFLYDSLYRNNNERFRLYVRYDTNSHYFKCDAYGEGLESVEDNYLISVGSEKLIVGANSNEGTMEISKYGKIERRKTPLVQEAITIN